MTSDTQVLETQRIDEPSTRTANVFQRIIAVLCLAIVAQAVVFFKITTAAAQQPVIPYFWDPQFRLERPETPGLRSILFITDDEYPPLGFTAPDGSLIGFNVDLARAICEELRVTCTIQARRWDTIVETIEKGQADAAIASLAITPAMRKRVDFTAPYYRTPARFVVRKSPQNPPATPEALAGQSIAVQEKTAHEAFLRMFFKSANVRTYATLPDVLRAVRAGDVQNAFGDGVTMAIWLNGQEANGCCTFRGGPFTERRFFGEGVGIAVRRENQTLRRALDFALMRVAERGTYADLYLKYFPIGFY
jgi:polar amino acid transport system substrate-binding protein